MKLLREREREKEMRMRAEASNWHGIAQDPFALLLLFLRLLVVGQRCIRRIRSSQCQLEWWYTRIVLSSIRVADHRGAVDR